MTTNVANSMVVEVEGVLWQSGGNCTDTSAADEVGGMAMEVLEASPSLWRKVVVRQLWR
jgi:hypothetical protein